MFGKIKKFFTDLISSYDARKPGNLTAEQVRKYTINHINREFQSAVYDRIVYIENIIRTKTENGSFDFGVMVNIPPGKTEVHDKVVEHFQKKGFKVEIKRESDIIGDYMIISWPLAQSEEEEKKK